LLVEDIWDSVAEVPISVELSEPDKAELDGCLDLYHENPESGSPWGMVKERIKNNYRAFSTFNCRSNSVSVLDPQPISEMPITCRNSISSAASTSASGGMSLEVSIRLP